MSWAEVFKINNNMKKTINEQIRDTICSPIRVITSNTTYTPEKTGMYKVICVGAGGNSDGFYGVNTTLGSGGGGGVAIKIMKLLSTQNYNVTVGSTASFGSTLTATAGGVGSSNNNGGTGGAGGTASGGDFNFTGETGSGIWYGKTSNSAKGGNVGTFITELSRQAISHEGYSAFNIDLVYGMGILTYGGGAPGAVHGSGVLERTGQPGAVIIIPLEMEE